MAHYKCYTRGHGSVLKAHLINKNENIDLITVGAVGCTMQGDVADTIIYQHWSVAGLQDKASDDEIIYWTHNARQQYRQYGGRPIYTQPVINRNNMDYPGVPNLSLFGADNLGDKCGLCYYDSAKADLVWLVQLDDDEEITLNSLTEKISTFINEGDTVDLFWTACMAAGYWSGNKMAVSFNPAN